MDHRKGAQKGRETCPFRALDGFNGIRLSALERMAGTTRLELATSAVTEFVVGKHLTCLADWSFNPRAAEGRGCDHLRHPVSGH
jgi:hypothetical protein